MDINDLTWNPWHGCHKCSEGCQNCYAYFLDKRYGRDTNEVADAISFGHRQADQTSLPALWGVVIYLFYGYFHPIPESEHHLAIKPNRHVFHHNPPQFFIKLR